ncbi:hypothetical protein D6856_14980 [Butyrivibrio sp. XB500-5]|uniref:hypothetical protein n=1 Tax=Butyrivibrio sp. XB500-5 TaxID=2364880 RepID=UPI000EAAB5B0|nr:hypothetical protein [Butyrivibrio sp. XB500-5]RKM56039.1 hypothetical protein D6856_14980 [Butyrivibrio sp. XB500-5]
MGLFDFLRKKNNDKAPSVTSRPEALFDIISGALVDGELPESFSLPTKDDSRLHFADGAEDGICIYHMGRSANTDETKKEMGGAVTAASSGDFSKADQLFDKLGTHARALYSIDDIQAYILQNREKLNPTNCLRYAIHAITTSSCKETVKYGLCILELFNTDEKPDVKNIIRTIGLCDEFTLFSVFIMRAWKNGNEEILNLAKKVHGWGRVHAVERIEAVTDEIKRWLLIDGVHNNVLPAYSAMDCWTKSGAYEILKGNPTKEEFAGIRDIIDGLLDEGPVTGISQFDDGDDIIISFLKHAKNMCDCIEDYKVVRSIRIHYDDDKDANPEIASLCKEILFSDI